MTTTLVVWSMVIFARQFTYLFSGRAKASGSLWYSWIAGLGSHQTFFWGEVLLIALILDFQSQPLMALFWISILYTLVANAGTVAAQHIALRMEKGKMQVGSR